MRLIVLAAIIAAIPSGVAQAQQFRPVPPLVADVRAFYGGLGQDPVTAANLGVAATALPKRGLGGVIGLHVYPIRKGSFAVGVGGEGMLARGRAQAKDAAGLPVGEPIGQRILSLSPQVSLNFGHREGWSYLSAGMGPMIFETYQGELPPAETPPRKITINMGGGARWFVNAHVAFCFDVRFYLTKPEVQTPDFPGRQRTRLMMMSAGVAFK